MKKHNKNIFVCLGYVLVYLLKTKLPWQGQRGATKRQKYERICEVKSHTEIEHLCASLPPEFAHYLSYCRTLSFEADPNYSEMSMLSTSPSTFSNPIYIYYFNSCPLHKIKNIRYLFM